MELQLLLEITIMSAYNPMTITTWPPIDPGYPRWSLGSHWMATILQHGLQMTQVTPNGASALAGRRHDDIFR